MGFLDDLFNRNPTKDWRAEQHLELLLDMDSETFCGIGIGDDARRLSKLGPAEDAAAARNGWYRYPAHGFDITTEQGRVVEFQLRFDPDETYGGHVRINGNELPLEGDITEAVILKAAGTPTERIVDDDPDGDQEITLRYTRTRADWQFELNEEGKLSSIWGGKRD
jgi:hypothetical protein